MGLLSLSYAIGVTLVRGVVVGLICSLLFKNIKYDSDDVYVYVNVSDDGDTNTRK